MDSSQRAIQTKEKLFSNFKFVYELAIGRKQKKVKLIEA